MPESGWRSWQDDKDEIWRAEFLLTKYDARRMHPDRLSLLGRAGELIQKAFAEPEEPTPEGEYMRMMRNVLDELEATLLQEVLQLKEEDTTSDPPS